MVDTPLCTIDDDIPACGLESQANTDTQRQPSEVEARLVLMTFWVQF